jgi:type VI secretion system protein ImpF
MARFNSDPPVTLSVLDRLIDQDPRTPADPYSTRAQSVRQLKQSLRRDLEWLLNTRRIATPAKDSYPYLHKSLYNFGLPDFSSWSLNSPKDRGRLLRELELTISRYEPRLANVRVSPVEVAGVNTRMLRFQIEGLLLLDPAPEHISFDTVLELSSGEYQIKGERGA